MVWADNSPRLFVMVGERGGGAVNDGKRGLLHERNHR